MAIVPHALPTNDSRTLPTVGLASIWLRRYVGCLWDGRTTTHVRVPPEESRLLLQHVAPPTAGIVT